MLDKDGYPTQATLKKIRTRKDANEALDLVAELWSDYGTVSRGPLIRGDEASVVEGDVNERYLRVTTGGWSGNEDLISALGDNFTVWSLTWCLSARGGLYIFRYLGGDR